MKKIAFPFAGFLCIVALTQCNSSTSKTDTTTNDTTTMKTSDSNNITANWKIGVQMWTFKEFTFAEALNKADSAGIRYIEAFWGQPLGAGMIDSFGIRMSDETKAQLKQMLQQKGI